MKTRMHLERMGCTEKTRAMRSNRVTLVQKAAGL